MVATRSGRVNSGGPPPGALVSDGLAEVKATRQRRGAGSKSVIKAQEVEQAEQAEALPEPEAPMYDEPSIEVFKMESAIKMSPRQPSQTSTPASPASGQRMDHVSPATKEAGVRPRRLSMREVVVEAAELPLPSEEASPPPTAKLLPTKKRTKQKHTSSHPTWLSATICVLLTAAVAVGVPYLACNQPLPSNLQAAVQPHCAQAGVFLSRFTTLNADLQSQGHATWAQAGAKAQSMYTQGSGWLQAQTHSAYAQTTGWLQAQRESVLSSQLGVKLYARYLQLQITVKGLLSRTPPLTPLAATLPTDALRELVLQAAGLPDVDDIYQHVAVAAKGTGVLVACGSVCADVQRSIASSVQQAQHLCEVDGSLYSAPGTAGALQAQLATFLSASPAGLVVISGLTQMAAESLAVLSNTLSEGGNLQLRGRAVGTTHALYIVLAASEVAAGGEADRFEAKVKAEVQLSMAAMPSSGTHDAPTLALALRRRFDFVLPAAAAARAAEAEAAERAATELGTEGGEEVLAGATEEQAAETEQVAE